MIDLRLGDCRTILPALESDSIDACVTDPPYGLEFMGKEWDKLGDIGKSRAGFSRGAPAVKGIRGEIKSLPQYNAQGNIRCRKCGKWKWGHKTGDGGGGGLGCECEQPDFPNVKAIQGQAMQEWHYQWATEVYRVLKPGAYLLAFGGTRTYHRMVCAIEDAGFEIRDSIDWVYGSGFPKSLDISLAIDRAACLEALVEKLGRGPTKEEFKAAWKEWREVICSAKYSGRRNTSPMPEENGWNGNSLNGKYSETAPATDAAREWSGWGTALKPAHEPIVVARKPLSESTVAANVLRWGTGAINVDKARVEAEQRTNIEPDRGRITGNAWHGGLDGSLCGSKANGMTAQGRFPANLITDGSAEVVAMFPTTTPSKATMRGNLVDNRSDNYGRANGARIQDSDYMRGHDDSGGSAARFFKSCPLDEEDIEQDIWTQLPPKREFEVEMIITSQGRGKPDLLPLDEDDYPPLFYCAKASKAERNTGLEGMPKQKKHTSSGDDHVINEICPKHHITLCPCGWRSPEVHNFHPCVKPLSLMRYLITLCTREGATVLDPFCGSGSTLVACVQLGRNGIGCDNNAEYIEIAKRRIEAATPIAIELPLKVEA